MNFKKLAVVTALGLAGVLGIMIYGGQRTRAAGTWYVSPTGTPSGVIGGSCTSPSFNTIGPAVTAASSGDTIQVCAGTYSEQVQITKTLTLKGAQAGVDARTRIAASESIIDHPCGPVQIMADKVVIDGFTIEGSILPDPCFLSAIWTNPGFSGTQGGHQILNNIVQNSISGIELDSTCVNPTLVQFNLIQANDKPGPGSGNGIQTNFGLCNATIDSNKFSSHTNASILVLFTGSSGLTVSNNELVAGFAPTGANISFIGVSNSTITGNKSIGSTSSGTIDLFGGNSNIAVNGNVLRTGQRGLLVENPYASFGVGPNTGITAHTNCLVGNTVAGLEVTAASYSGILNAENNWWGSASGPTIASNPGGTGDKIIDPDGVVDYTPFLISDASTPCAPPPVGPPTNKDQCKDDGWKSFNVPRKFKSQGDCIQFVNTGK